VLVTSPSGLNSSNTYKIVKLDSGDTLIHAADDLLGDSSRVNVLWIQAIA
jgi:hypothetical protein